MSDPAPFCWVLIPVKAPGEGKTRLAGALDPFARAALVRSMLERVVDAAEGCEAVERVCLVGTSDYGLGSRVTVLDDGGADLSGGLETVIARIPIVLPSLADRERGSDAARQHVDAGVGTPPSQPPPSRWEEPGPAWPQRLIIVAGDLPQIDHRDFAMLADLPPDAIGIAPDRHGTGTNALSIPHTIAPQFRFQFGPGSYGLHRAEATRLGYTAETLLSDGLEKDIDEPADLADARGCQLEAH